MRAQLALDTSKCRLDIRHISGLPIKLATHLTAKRVNFLVKANFGLSNIVVQPVSLMDAEADQTKKAKNDEPVLSPPINLGVVGVCVGGVVDLQQRRSRLV